MYSYRAPFVIEPQMSSRLQLDHMDQTGSNVEIYRQVKYNVFRKEGHMARGLTRHVD